MHRQHSSGEYSLCSEQGVRREPYGAATERQTDLAGVDLLTAEGIVVGTHVGGDMLRYSLVDRSMSSSRCELCGHG